MLTVKIDAAANGDNLLVPGVAGRRIQVLDYVLNAHADVVVRWRSGSTDLSGPLRLVTGGVIASAGATDGMRAMPKLATDPGDPLRLSLNGAVQVGGHVTYEIVG